MSFSPLSAQDMMGLKQTSLLPIVLRLRSSFTYSDGKIQERDFQHRLYFQQIQFQGF